MEEGASFYANTSNGFNSSTRRFSQMTIGKNANFHVTDAGRTRNRSTSRPMIDIANTITVDEEAVFLVETEVNRSEMIYFRNARASLNLQGVQRFELIHPTTRAGTSRTTLQQLIRSNNNTVADGLSINFENQKFLFGLEPGSNPTKNLSMFQVDCGSIETTGATRHGEHSMQMRVLVISVWKMWKDLSPH